MISASAKLSLNARPVATPARQARSVRTYAVENDTKPQEPPSTDASTPPVVDQARPSTSSPSLDQKIVNTLAPRVSQLRGRQLSAGLTDPSDIFSFYGPLPELLNGRLAMLGFVACMGAEYVSHQTLLQQVFDAPVAILVAFNIIAIASLIPIVRGSKILDDGSGDRGFKLGSFNVTNELINGRAAMLGFAIVVIYETVAGGPLFN